jgi:hypothetical protein
MYARCSQSWTRRIYQCGQAAQMTEKLVMRKISTLGAQMGQQSALNS